VLDIYSYLRREFVVVVVVEVNFTVPTPAQIS